MNCFLVEMSTKKNIQIDEDEIKKVIQGIKKGNPIIVRQGIINPSFFVDITEDKGRINEYEKNVIRIKRENKQVEYMKIGNMRPIPKMQPLKDIFKKMKLLK